RGRLEGQDVVARGRALPRVPERAGMAQNCRVNRVVDAGPRKRFVASADGLTAPPESKTQKSPRAPFEQAGFDALIRAWPVPGESEQDSRTDLRSDAGAELPAARL